MATKDISKMGVEKERKKKEREKERQGRYWLLTRNMTFLSR